MNLSEVELVLKDLVKEVQETKALVEKSDVPIAQNEISESLSYSLRILPKKMDRLNLIMDMVLKKPSKGSGVESTKLIEELQKSLERNIHQLKNPVLQKIRQEHSFKDWKWLLLLFFFIGLSLFLGWCSIENGNRYHDLLKKYEYVQKVAPDFSRAVDSVINTNPSFLLKYYPNSIETNKIPDKTSKKKHKQKR